MSSRPSAESPTKHKQLHLLQEGIAMMPFLLFSTALGESGVLPLFGPPLDVSEVRNTLTAAGKMPHTQVWDFGKRGVLTKKHRCGCTSRCVLRAKGPKNLGLTVVPTKPNIYATCFLQLYTVPKTRLIASREKKRPLSKWLICNFCGP